MCDTCKAKNAPRWASAHGATLLVVSPESRAEFFRREAEAVSSILRIERLKDSATALAEGNIHLAHDMGDGGVVNHCPFCGSGAVVGGSDGSVECGFCHTVFSVQVQPNNPSMPQTVNGQPFVPPGMPAGEPTEMSEPKDPVAEQADQQDGEDPSGAQQPGHPSSADPNPSSKDMITDRQQQPPHEKAKAEDAAKQQGLPGDKPTDPNANPFAKGGDPDKAQPGAKGDPKKGQPPVPGGGEPKDAPLDPTAPVLYVPEDAPAGGRPEKVDKAKGDDDDSKGKSKNLPPWMKKKTSAEPTVLGSFRTSDGVLDGDAYMKRLALQFADDRQQVLAEIRREAVGPTFGDHRNANHETREVPGTDHGYCETCHRDVPYR